MRLDPWAPRGIRTALIASVCVYALVGGFALAGLAGQSRTVSDGVYSAAQAKRGQQLYDEQCAACHGAMLEGVVGPMLAGDPFLAIWGGRSLSEFVDKIQNTMPLQAPGSLTREQSADITAYVLQVGKFSAGQTDLAPAALAQIAFPGAVAAPAAAAGAVTLTPDSNLAQYMRAVTFPNANIIFNVQVKDPGEDKPRPPVPFDYLQWGYTVYYGWQAVDQAALALVETTPLFMLPGRRCENGRPVPIDRADYKQYTQDLVDLSREIYRASQSRNVEAVREMADRLNDACANCHAVYRDVGTAEGGGQGADRCR